MLIRGGTVVTAEGGRNAGGFSRDEKVAEVREGIAGDADVIDATGLLVLPGVVDPHTHLLLDTGTARTADDFESGSLSAAAGGVTTFLDFAPQLAGQRFGQALQSRLDLIAGRSYIDYAIHLNIAHLPAGWEHDLAALVEAGGARAEIYTTYRGTIFYADDWSRYQLMERAREAGFLVQVHAEKDAIVEGMGQQLVDAGERSLKFHALARPGVAEAQAVGRGLLFSRATRRPVHLR